MIRRSTLITTAADAARERGAPWADVLVGSNQRDVLDGRGGGDEILGLGGVDTLISR